MEKEIYKDVVGYEGLYQISNLGNVRSLDKVVKNSIGSGFNTRKGKQRKAKTEKQGYITIQLSKNGQKKLMKIHRLVAMAFIPNPKNKPQVNHINGIKSDNTVENLEWNTYKENINHAFSNNLNTVKRGSNHPNSKLSEQDILEIRQNKNNSTHLELSKKYNVSRSNITQIINKTAWNNVINLTAPVL